jgi:hypothetical protein
MSEGGLSDQASGLSSEEGAEIRIRLRPEA